MCITFTYPVLLFIGGKIFNTPVMKHIQNRHGHSVIKRNGLLKYMFHLLLSKDKVCRWAKVCEDIFKDNLVVEDLTLAQNKAARYSKNWYIK